MYQQRTSVPLGSLKSNWVLWKTPLSLFSRVSIFNLEEKKITALLFGCMKIYGAGWFPGSCSCRALLWWCTTVTCHQCSQALMIHCRNKSFVTRHCPRAPLPHLRLSSPAGSPGSKRAACSHCPPTTTTLTTRFSSQCKRRKIVLGSKVYWTVLRLLKVNGSYTLMP